MTEFIWIVPILASVAIVLGTCRGETLTKIAEESGRTFIKMVVGIALLCVALEAVLYVVPRLT